MNCFSESKARRKQDEDEEATKNKVLYRKSRRYDVIFMKSLCLILIFFFFFFFFFKLKIFFFIMICTLPVCLQIILPITNQEQLPY